MVFGIGTDLVQIKRIEDILFKDTPSFLNRICHEKEKHLFNETPDAQKAAKLAKWFAAKEAVAKAFGTGIRDGISFADIEITHDPKGKPFVRLHGTTKTYFDTHIHGTIHLSLSDEAGLAFAFALVEK